MNSITNDAHDAGRLLGFALASRSPATSKDYADLLRRSEEEPSLRAITDGVCDGLGLRVSKWLEPHDGDRLHFSTLVHQILSCLREAGGMPAGTLFTVLVKNGAFRCVTESMFSRVLRSLGEHEFIEQTPTGELILAPQGERITSDRDFYAAFAASEEFLIRHDGREIGKLPSSIIPPVGENLILGGRRWRVDDIQTLAKTVFVSPAKGGKAPVFRGTGGEVHNRVVEEMRAVLADANEMPFLDGAAQTLLKAGREMATRAGVLSPGFIIREESVQWFPWLGTRGLLTLELHARCDGISVETDLLSITYKKTSLGRWRAHLESVQRGDRSALDLAQHMSVKTFEKFDDALAEDLLDESNARDRLDLLSASACSMHALELLQNGATVNAKA